jgi:dTDP-4-amino-4,6-dideoxy-D-galactose acyltransferase
MTFEHLPWDSELFGFPVARLPSASVTAMDFSRALTQMTGSGIRLAYATVPWTDSASRSLLENAQARLVDRKLLYRKALAEEIPSDPGIESWQGLPCTPVLESLALASGHWSRFRMDRRIPEAVFSILYLTWIRRSLRGEIADDVLVSRMTDEVAGMVTLALRREIGTIGLLAVSEAYRGHGLGRRLFRSSERWCKTRGAIALEVVTQADNAAACGLYESCGCRIVTDEAVYHLWMEPMT